MVHTLGDQQLVVILGNISKEASDEQRETLNPQPAEILTQGEIPEYPSPGEAIKKETNS